MVKKKASLKGLGNDRSFEVAASVSDPPSAETPRRNDALDRLVDDWQDFGDAQDAAGVVPTLFASPKARAPVEVAPAEHAIVDWLTPNAVVAKQGDLTAVAAQRTQAPVFVNGDAEKGVQNELNVNVPVPPRARRAANGSAPASLARASGPGAFSYEPTNQGGAMAQPTMPAPSRPALVVPAVANGIAGPTYSASVSPKNSTINSMSANMRQESSGTSSASTASRILAAPAGEMPLSPTPASADLARRLKDEIALTDNAQRAGQDLQDDPRVKEFREHVFSEIGQLYLQVAKTIHDSPKVAEYCLDLLRQARELAFGSDRAGELSKAEYFAEKVRTKLAHSDDPIPPEEVWHVRAVLAWNFIALAVSAALATLPWVFPKADIQVAGVALIRAEFVPLLTTLGWGGIGGVIGTLYNMPWFVQIREYDPAYNLDYIARPIKGLTAGGLVYLLYLTGMLTLNGVTIDQAGDKFIIPCFIAALSGFKQEYVFELFDKILQAVFRTPPPTPRQIDPGANKK